MKEKYLLGRALGQGGFGITYLAFDTSLNVNKLAINQYLPLDLALRAAGRTTISVISSELTASFQYGLVKFLEEARAYRWL